MIKIAIVGNIASGKSTVEQFIEQHGYKVFDTDKIAHQILEKSEEVKNLFGTLDRKEIATIVFSNNDKLKLLESIIHPEVKSKLLEIFNQNYELVFVSVPQLFESGMENLFDKVIYITANKEVRKARLIKRNALTEEDATKRISAQNELNKKERADFVINNDGDLIDLEKQVKNILKQIINT